MRSDDPHHRHDATCRTCGTPVAAPVFFDTRGHHYCSAECGENVGLADAQAHPHAHVHVHAHVHAHAHAPAAMEMR